MGSVCGGSRVGWVCCCVGLFFGVCFLGLCFGGVGGWWVVFGWLGAALLLWLVCVWWGVFGGVFCDCCWGVGGGVGWGLCCFGLVVFVWVCFFVCGCVVIVLPSFLGKLTSDLRSVY
ncbi:hypothetical protein, partial [Pseudomonas syringae group genomosp. 7]|uniref:hypothetical protein n=1 Tax=Pseudomonas syringae group genomosp. 7 TaxID=251699 RepID=UPI0037702CBA